jgi:hypothetical protein
MKLLNSLTLPCLTDFPLCCASSRAITLKCVRATDLIIIRGARGGSRTGTDAYSSLLQTIHLINYLWTIKTGRTE